jgi:hypothetical protein
VGLIAIWSVIPSWQITATEATAPLREADILVCAGWYGRLASPTLPYHLAYGRTRIAGYLTHPPTSSRIRHLLRVFFNPNLSSRARLAEGLE